MITNIAIDTWLRQLSTDHYLYALLSGSSISEALSCYYQLDGSHTPEGIWLNTPYRDWSDVMPRLVLLNKDSPFIDWVNKQTEQSWGWLASGPCAQGYLIHKLRRLTKVRLPDKREVFFRYWDGKYFFKVLEVSDVLHQKALLGGVTSVWSGHLSFQLPPVVEFIPDNDILTFTQLQTDALQQQQKQLLWYEIRDDFYQRFPHKARSLGKNNVDSFIDLTIEKTTKYRLTRRDQIKQYLELALILGSHFDDDPLLKTWIQEPIKEAHASVSSLIQLKETLAEPMRNSMGDKMSVYRQRLIALMQKNIHHLLPITDKEHVIPFVRSLYPERCAELPAEALPLLYEKSISLYFSQGFYSYRSHAILLGIQLFLGHGVFRDPLYPWATRLINYNSVMSDEQRVNILIDYAKKRIRKEIINLEHYWRVR
ncbi:DUF4123 domain-containing protein [Salmonella enterica]|nr:DUF4123 domain-containing protein [Salmonella enterica]